MRYVLERTPTQPVVIFRMKTFYTCLALCCFVLISFAFAPLTSAAEPLNDSDAKFMVLYEQVLKGFVQSNLQVAKDAAHALPNGDGKAIEDAKDLKEGRAAFATLSQHAEKIVAGHPDYHVFYCPMVKQDWVQKSTTVANPYLGADMLTCGVEKKNP